MSIKKYKCVKCGLIFETDNENVEDTNCDNKNCNGYYKIKKDNKIKFKRNNK